MEEIDPYISRLVLMNDLIRRECTGAPEAFAATLKVSVRTLNDYLIKLKVLLSGSGVTIFYNREMETYQYSKPGFLDVCCKWRDPGAGQHLADDL